jgi:hypothetical protein
MINQDEQLQWERLAQLFGKRFFKENKPLETMNGTKGISQTVTVKDGDGNNISLTFIEGILTEVS